MPSTGSSPPGRSIAWALLSQMIWLPLVGIDLQQRWQSQLPIPPPLAAGRGRQQAAAVAAAPLPAPLSLADLLDGSRADGSRMDGSGPDGSGMASRHRGADRGIGSIAAGRSAPLRGLPPRGLSGGGLTAEGLLLLAPTGRERGGAGSRAGGDLLFSSAALGSPSPAGPGSLPQALIHEGGGGAASERRPEAVGRSGALFRGSQLLGGAIGLEDLQEGPMPALALVERSLRSGDRDPLAPLPEPWREPMRQALRRLPGSGPALDTARVITLPSGRIQQPTEVPLSLQSDGSVDILAAPAEPALLRDVEHWSRRQLRPALGRQAPALLRFQPLPAETRTASSAAGAGSGAAGATTAGTAAAGSVALPAAGRAALAAAPAERRPPPAATAPGR